MSQPLWRTVWPFLVLLLFGGPPDTNAQAPYAAYETTAARISELEWRLLHVNVAVTSDAVEVDFDAKRQIFVAVAWVLTYTVDRTDVPQLRKLFSSQAEKLAAKLGQQFPEFKNRNDRDLEIDFLLGRSGRDRIAFYEKGTIQFTDAFYAYLRERERR